MIANVAADLKGQTMPAPSSVLELVERFQRDIAAYKSPAYNETQTRQEFIDPLFEALGWDIGNRQGAAAAFREVVLEYSMKIGAATKAPDYLFQLGGTPRFFVEAKKPSVNLKDDTSPAFQLRRYAWSATLPLSVLTDFEEFVVYDCRVEPDKKDKPTVARMFYLPYTEYAEKWDTIAELFSREAVLGGSLEKFAQEQKAPKGATPVDVAFLREIEGWRELLAKNIAIWNPELTQRELNYAVQMTIDRLIFLRICEDRGIEPYGKLQRLLKGGQLYKELVAQFRDADDRYNSGLFHFAAEKGREEPDGVTPGLYIDDEPLKKIVRGLYYPDSPYEFSVLPVEILGNVYEQFLGKVIHLTKNHEAVVVEKPEVRKAGGVYYTPSYIVDYIVRHTVGKLLEGKTLKDAAKLRIVDPACGSGSFLLGAYQYLLDWYLAQYVAAGPAKHKKDLYQGPRGEWKLTSAARKRILLDNIYGVDIDAQAVEVTKLSLSLKVLEGENEQTIGTTRSMFQERALPDLSNNIKCGNSVIGQNFYDSLQPGQLTDEEQYNINPFDWNGKGGFSEIMRAGGFDAVIGNPPYVRPHNLEPEVKSYFWQHFSTFVKKSDLYCTFIERATHLLKPQGVFGYIVSNSWLRLDSFEELRVFLLNNVAIDRIIDFTGNVFSNASVKTVILFFTKKTNIDQNIEVTTTEVTTNLLGLQFSTIPQEEFRKSYKSIFDLSIDASQEVIKKKMQSKGSSLGAVSNLSFGLKTGDDTKFLTYTPLGSEYKLLLRGEDVHRYSTAFKGEYVWYVPSQMTAHRRTARPGNAERFEQPKVLIRDTGEGLQGTFDGDNYYVKDVLVVADSGKDASKLKYLTGVLNSKLMRFYYETSFPTLHVQRDELASLPIAVINVTDPTDKKRHDDMVALVERMLDLHKRAAAAKTGQERTVLQRQIEGTDRQIDKLVYSLYGLTDDEIAIVEAATK